jgi:hypothetical protein
VDRNRTSFLVLWLAAGTVWIVALAMTVETGTRIQQARGRLASKLSDWQELRTLEKEMERYRVARRFFDGLPVKHPAPVDPLLKKAGLEARVKDIANPPRAIPGWTVRQKDVDFAEAEVSVAKVLQSVAEIEQAETNRPPWRMARFSVHSSARNPGTGQVVVLLESLEQSDAGPGAKD